MMKVLFFLCLFGISFADIPLANTPSWISTDTDFSTGGALYDITMDSWIDYCTGNGNDMASNTNAIYINNSGVLETTASWRSYESGYFSHIYIGDIDNDGKPDMAVSYLGAGISNQGPTRIYRNNGAGLADTAWWTSSDQYNSFDCAFGDVDLDADLDLAVIAGDAYTNVRSPTRIYRNNNGTIETTPYWTSTDSTPGDACRWIDVDNDGFLDLIVGYRHKLAVFKNNSGTLENIASWSIIRPGWILRIAVGDYNNDGYKDIAVASNGQLGGDSSRIEVYQNQGGTLQTTPACVMLKATDFCSCVEWGDVNNDGWLDLAAGGWWEPVVVFENITGNIDTTPAWFWDGGSGLVCETVMWGDVRNLALATTTEYKNGNGTRKLFYVNHHPMQSSPEIKVNSTPVPLSDFTFDPLTGWISLKNAPASGTNNIEIEYSYSQYPDLGVTNWDDANGNYLFHNTTMCVAEKKIGYRIPNLSISVVPNPFKNTTRITINTKHTLINPGIMTLTIYDISGRAVKKFLCQGQETRKPISITWDGSDDLGRKLSSGFYLIEVKIEKYTMCEKIVIVK